MTRTIVARLEDELVDQAWLFDDPEAYLAGVEDALRAVRQLPVGVDDAPEPRTQPASSSRTARLSTPEFARVAAPETDGAATS